MTLIRKSEKRDELLLLDPTELAESELASVSGAR
jgi:hypothetical protein